MQDAVEQSRPGVLEPNILLQLIKCHLGTVLHDTLQYCTALLLKWNALSFTVLQ
jgi:hypothetical protein